MLAMEAAHRATAGITAAPRVTTLLKAAEDIARRIDSHYARGMVEMARGFASLMVCEWKSAAIVLWTRLTSSFAIIARASPGNATPFTTSSSGALVQRGELAELLRRWSGLFRESQERGDLYAATLLTTFYKTMINLARNESLDSDAELEAAVDRRAERGFSLQNSAALESLIHLYLYRGDISRAGCA